MDYSPPIVVADTVQKFHQDHALLGEFDAAIASRNIPQLKLFVARHPDSELAHKAQALIDRLVREQKK